MVVDGNKIKVTSSSGVSIADVQQVLRDSSTDLGRLCTSNRINMWAKWKPIKAPYLGLMTTSIMENLYSQGVYPYGINRGGDNVLLWNTSTGVISHNVWQYDKPTGTSSSPYRLADFSYWDDPVDNKGYYHLAPCPINAIFSGSELNISDDNNPNIVPFILTFQNAIDGWQVDDTCLSIADLLDVDYYLTIGLLHWDNGAMKQYLKSTSQKLSVLASSNPYAIIEVDLTTFRDIIGSNYLTSGQKWTAIMFLSGHQYAGTNIDHELNDGDSIHMLECTENADRQIMTVVRSSWADYYFSEMTLTTYLTKDGSNGYRLYKSGGYGLSFDVTRNSTKLSEQATFSVSLELTCVGGSVGEHGMHVSMSNIGTISFAMNESQKTFNYNSLTGYNFKFEERQNIKRAIITVIIERTGDVPGEYNLSTDTDCSGGNNTYEVTNSKSNV